MPAKDITGMRFGRYTVIERVENDKHGNAVWLCRCDCGKEKKVIGASLRKGVVVSCGCYHKEKLKQTQTTHGESKSRLFEIWRCMKSRCYNKNHKNYDYYGGRGIIVCEDWKNNYVAFAEWARNNGYAENLTIDRIDVDGNYEPSNCRWVSRKEQMENTRVSHIYTINGESKCLSEWCKVYNVPHERVRSRVINRGWNIIDALTTPPLDSHGNQKKR